MNNFKVPTDKEISSTEKKLKTLDFIEHNAKKEEFLHWIINNKEDIVFSSEESWEDLKQEIATDKRISPQELRNYAKTLRKEDITEEAIEEVVEVTKDAEEVAEKLNFIGRFKKFSIAIGGGLVILSLINLALTGVILFSPHEYVQFSNVLISLGTAAYLLVTGIAELLGGILLIVL